MDAAVPTDSSLASANANAPRAIRKAAKARSGTLTRARTRSIELDAFGLHHLAPFGDCLRHPVREVLRAAGPDVAAELDDPVGDLWRREHFADLRVQPRRHDGGRSLAGEKSLPGPGLHDGHVDFLEARQVRYLRQPLVARYRDPFELVLHNERNRRQCAVEDHVAF